MAETPDRTNATQNARQPPEVEYRFDQLDEDEYEDCFRYEIQRYQIPSLRAKFHAELAALPLNVEMPTELDDFEGSHIARKLDLQGRLSELKEYESPWLQLREGGIPPFLRGAGLKTSELSELLRVRGIAPKLRSGKRATRQPVQLINEIDPLTRCGLLVEEPHIEKLQIVIDWTKSPTSLAESFLLLVKRMRKQRGRARLRKERRGRPRSSIENDLFALAVWRCSKCEMTHSKIWDFLEPLRKKWQIAWDRKRQLGFLSRRIEGLVSQ
jgi:hypothetical protein